MRQCYWEIELLGGLKVRHGAASTRLKTSKTGELMAYLALHPHPHTRDHLAMTLWPEQEDASAGKASLRTALASLSRQLEPPESKGRLLSADGGSICIDKELCRIDTQSFQNAVTLAQRSSDLQTQLRQYRSAFEEYKGPLLPGFVSDWIDAERMAFADLHQAALLQFASLLLDAGQAEQAVDSAMQLLRLDPAHEEATLLVMQAHARTGRKQEALKAFARLQRAVVVQYESEPSQELVELASRIRRGPASLETPRSPSVIAVPPLALNPDSADFGEKVVPTATALAPRNSAFFGRSEELWQIIGLLHPSDPPDASQVRLVTLTGMGGIGKSRLATEAAHSLQSKFVRFASVALSAISDPRRIADEILRELSIPRRSEVEGAEQLIEHLQGQPTLLLLDNFEQLLTESPEVFDGSTLLAHLIGRLPHLRLLVTSRCSVGLPGEKEIVVSPLRVPPAGIETASEVVTYPSVQMYLRRAQEKRADFTATERTAPAIAELCRRLEGIPLALELAAACINDYAPSRILADFDRRFEFLKSRFRDMSERHRTLQAAIEWSYQTLSPEQQQFFVTLAVFRGGFSSEAALSISGADAAQDYLKQLQSRSLILQDEGTQRYRLLDTLRDFALQNLPSERKTRISRRHAVFYYRLAKRTAFQLFGENQVRLLEMLNAENDNLCACLDFLCGSRAGLRMTGALHQFWDVRGHHELGLRYMEQAYRNCPRASTRLRSSCLNGMGVFARQIGDYGKAEEYLNQALECRRALRDDLAVAGLNNNLGLLALQQGNPHRANQLARESSAVYRRLGQKRLLAASLDNLAGGYLQLRELDEIETLLSESQLLLEEEGDNTILASILTHRGQLAHQSGDLPKAHRLFQQAIRLQEAMQANYEIAGLLLRLAVLARLGRLIPRCVMLCAAAVRCTETHHCKFNPDDKTTLDACLEQARRSLSPNRYAGSWSTGYAFTTAEAIHFACDLTP